MPDDLLLTSMPYLWRGGPLVDMARRPAMAWETAARMLREHAEHCEITPKTVRWWMDVMQLDVGEVASATGVRYSRIRNNSETPADLREIATWLEDARQRVYGGLYAALRDFVHAREWYDAPEERYGAAHDAAEDLLRDCLGQPLYGPPEVQHETAVARISDAPRPARMQCPKCGKVWTPRVPQPVRCPNARCQATFSWPDSELRTPIAPSPV